jgi:PKD repeat protein
VIVAVLVLLLLLPVAGAAEQSSPAPFQVVISATPIRGGAPLLVLFNATVSSGTPTLYEWSFGDGSTFTGVNASAADPAHTYSLPGMYAARVTVFEGNLSNDSSIAITAVAEPLTVTATASSTSGPAPLTVTFQAVPQGGSGTYDSLQWHFGDGGTGSGASVVYTYVRPGSFVATFTIVDSADHTATSSIDVNVTGSAPSGNAEGSLLAILPWLVIGFVLGLLAAYVVVRTTLRGHPTAGAVPPGVEASLAVPASLSADATPAPDPPTVAPAAGLSRSPPRTPDARTLGISQRIILHLAAQPRIGPDEVASPAFTQAGMANAIGAGQNSLTKVLRSLVAAGVLTEDVRHVTGRNRRLKVYRLTVRGEMLARELRGRGSPTGTATRGRGYAPP